MYLVRVVLVGRTLVWGVSRNALGPLPLASLPLVVRRRLGRGSSEFARGLWSSLSAGTMEGVFQAVVVVVIYLCIELKV